MIPIPCLIDTGAPSFMVLGTGTVNALKAQKVLRVKTNMMMKGSLRKNGRDVVDPIVYQLLDHYEDSHTRKDVRYNVLGIYGLQDFGYIIDFLALQTIAQ